MGPNLRKTVAAQRYDNGESISDGLSSMLNKLTFGIFGPSETDWTQPPVEGENKKQGDDDLQQKIHANLAGEDLKPI